MRRKLGGLHFSRLEWYTIKSRINSGLHYCVCDVMKIVFSTPRTSVHQLSTSPLQSHPETVGIDQIICVIRLRLYYFLIRLTTIGITADSRRIFKDCNENSVRLLLCVEYNPIGIIAMETERSYELINYCIRVIPNGGKRNL